MEQVKKRPRTTANKEQETFHKRKRGIQKKAHELSTFTKTDVYQVIFRDDQYYTFTSAVRDNWPPSNADIVRCHSSLPFT